MTSTADHGAPVDDPRPDASGTESAPTDAVMVETAAPDAVMPAAVGPGVSAPGQQGEEPLVEPRRDMRQLDYDELRAVVQAQPYPLVFATVSGAHLYGFPSADSDVDIRGAHLLPPEQVLGLRYGTETIDHTSTQGGVELDLVTHDLAKFCRLLLRRNGYVLEQLLSPLVVTTTDAHAELVALAPACVTRHHVHHYRGFARTQWELFGRTGELKPLLYTFRVILTGMHLMRTGQTEAHLPTLCRAVHGAPSYLADMVAAKGESEHRTLAGVPGGPDAEEIQSDVRQLLADLDESADHSDLPDQPAAEPALHDLLVRYRLHHRPS